MVVLRSHSKTPQTPLSPDPKSAEPETGSETEPVSARRRSLRLASKSDTPDTVGPSGAQRKRKSVEGEQDQKGKGKMKVNEFDLNVSEIDDGSGIGTGNRLGIGSGIRSALGIGWGVKRKVFTREEKGKGKMADIDLNLTAPSGTENGDDVNVGESESEVAVKADKLVIRDEFVKLVRELDEARNDRDGGRKRLKTVNSIISIAERLPNVRPEAVSQRMTRFREIARENAARFAHFASPVALDGNGNEDEDVSPSAEAEGDAAVSDGDGDVEDWPGPFSTALKIIRDREKKVNVQGKFYSSDKKKSENVTWVPKGEGQKCLKRVAPSLKELCLGILSDNADYLVSLEHVPDVLRHTLSQRLCDSRKMNGHFFDLLLVGCPTEVRVRDCSWMTEEQFTEYFQKCDTSVLTVLQLDQCGRCTPDYIVLSTLARTPNSLSALTTLSLSGACRLSDVGLKALVSSAPRLRSLNLSLCSLLTSSGINVLADSLGSTLRDLYINDCPSIDGMGILPALKKLQHLDVLALRGISNVSDKFMKGLIMERGYNMKELVLADCGKLTDSSIKVIAANCSALCALDLSNLPKLTDSALGHLANGCRAIKKLRLSQNNFSDEAIAAFLESSGEILKDLSLNGVRKVGHNTASSIARRLRNLINLDLSWCRKLTDECIGLIVDSCLSLRMLKVFGCTQITSVFLDGHSNPEVQIVGVNMCPILKHLEVPDYVEGASQYS